MRSELAAMKSEIKARTDGSYYFPDGEGVDAFLERDDDDGGGGGGDGRSGEEEDLTDADIESAVKYRAEADDLDLDESSAPYHTHDGRFALPVFHTRLTFTNGDTYEGEVVAGNRRHGKGVHRCSTGDFYDGEWKNNKRHGRGTMAYVRGLRYEGEWRDDKTHGEGMCVYENGDRYIGDWQHDKRWGWGLYELASGDVYEGEWFDDMMEGRGEYNFEPKNGGGKFSGEYGNGQRVKGRYVNGDGTVEYVGEWKNGGRHGYGTYFHAGLFKYKGTWKDDGRSGHGECVYADGSCHVGSWKDDKRHGRGRFVGVPTSLTSDDAMSRVANASNDDRPSNVTEVYDGDWVDDKRHGMGVAVYEDGTQYKGSFEKDVRAGRGKCVFGTTGEKYDGEFLNDVRHGRGICLYRDGGIYRGEWQNNQRHGYGVMRYADGTKFRGSWEDDGWVQSTAEPSRCHVFGPGISRAIAGDEAVFGIEARDEDGNARLSGGDAFHLRLVPAAGGADCIGSLADNEDGTYVARYTAEKAGRYLLHATLGDGEEVCDSPYPVLVLPTWPMPRSFTLAGEGCRRGVRHETCTFVVECRDRFGNHLDASCSDPNKVPAAAAKSSRGSAAAARRANEALAIARTSSTPQQQYVELDARLELAGGSGSDVHLTCGVEDLLDGTYLCTYTPPAAGFYRLVVRELRSGALVGESPYSVAVREAPMLTSAVDAAMEQSAPPVDLVRQWGAVAYSEFIALNHSENRERAMKEASKAKVSPVSATPKGGVDALTGALANLPPADEGWDSDVSEEETDTDKYIREHPDVAVVDNLEDIWRVGRLQREKKSKERAAKEKRLGELRDRLERENEYNGTGDDNHVVPPIAQLD